MSTPDYANLFEPAPSPYLLAHSVGRLPRATLQQVEQQFFAPWREGAAEPWPPWLASIEQFRSALAELLATSPELICPQPNLSSALSRIVSGLPVDPARATILLSEDDFPSMGFVLQQAQRHGYCLKYLPRGANICDLSVWMEALTEDVGLVFITHVQSNSGRRAPVQALGVELRRRHIVSIVDVAQSIGIVPIALTDWTVDFLIGSCVKWLCGGPGAGFLWANADILSRCEPVDVGWFSHQQPFEFDIHDFRYHDSALRFWGGTPSVLPYICATAGIQLLHNVGMTEVYRHNRALRAQLRKGLPAEVLISPEQDQHSGGTLILQFGDAQEKVAGRLRAAAVSFDIRSSGIRLSPHLYNDPAEIEQVQACWL